MPQSFAPLLGSVVANPSASIAVAPLLIFRRQIITLLILMLRHLIATNIHMLYFLSWAIFKPMGMLLVKLIPTQIIMALGLFIPYKPMEVITTVNTAI